MEGKGRKTRQGKVKVRYWVGYFRRGKGRQGEARLYVMVFWERERKAR